jgi:hypothetical protein
VPLKGAEEDELRYMTGYGHVVEEGLERVADRRENRRAERGPAPGSGSARGRAMCLVCFRQERSASRLRFDPNGKPRSLEPLSSSSSHIARALEEPRRGLGDRFSVSSTGNRKPAPVGIDNAVPRQS